MPTVPAVGPAAKRARRVRGIEQGNTVQKPEFIRAVSRATSLVEGTVDQAIKETRDQIVEFCGGGCAVKVDGLGIFTPTIDLDGNLAISFRADSAMNYGLNVPGTFTDRIINPEKIGTTTDEPLGSQAGNGWE